VVNSTDFSLGTKYSFPSLELFAAELPWSSMSIRQKSNADSLLGNVGQEWFSKRKSEQLYVFPRSEFDYALNDLGMSLSGSGNPSVFGGEMLWSSMSFRYHHFSVTHSLLSCRGHRSPDHSFQKTDSQPIGPFRSAAVITCVPVTQAYYSLLSCSGWLCPSDENLLNRTETFIPVLFTVCRMSLCKAEGRPQKKKILCRALHFRQKRIPPWCPPILPF
jgi:hypothetical protein